MRHPNQTQGPRTAARGDVGDRRLILTDRLTVTHRSDVAWLGVAEVTVPGHGIRPNVTHLGFSFPVQLSNN